MCAICIALTRFDEGDIFFRLVDTSNVEMIIPLASLFRAALDAPQATGMMDSTKLLEITRALLKDAFMPGSLLISTPMTEPMISFVSRFFPASDDAVAHSFLLRLIMSNFTEKSTQLAAARYVGAELELHPELAILFAACLYEVCDPVYFCRIHVFSPVCNPR